MKTEKDAYEWLKLNKFPFWRVCFASGQNNKAIIKNEGDEESEAAEENTSLEKSMVFFQKNIETLPDGQYIIYARKTLKGFNGELFYPFQIANDLPSNANYQNAAIQGTQIQQMNENFALQIKLIELQNAHRFELYEMQNKHEREAERLRRKAETPSVTGIDKYIQLIGSISNLMSSKPETEHKVEGVENEMEAGEVEQSIANSLETLQSVLGDDLPNGLEALSKFAKQSPEYVKNLINQMKNVEKN